MYLISGNITRNVTGNLLVIFEGMTNYPIGPHRTQSDPIGPHRTQSDPIGTQSDPIGPLSASFYRFTLHLGHEA